MCSKSELPDLADVHPLETIIYVSDEGFRPYILLNDIDDKPFWRPYGGETMEDIHKFHAWELEAQRKFSNEKRSSEELDYLRNLLMSVTLVADFFSFDEVMKHEMIGEILAKLSIMWYCTDNKLKIEDVKPEECADKLQPYYNLVMFYVTSFFTTVQGVAQRTGE